MLYDVGFRVDMGGKIGSGHFFRCLAIAEQLRKQKKKIVFLVKSEKEFLAHNNGKIPFIQLKKGSEKSRITHCKKLAENIKLIIVDLPTHSELYSKELSKNNKIVIFDDIGNKKISCDLLVNGTIVKNFQKYSIKNQNTKIAIGSKYLILREQFFENKKNKKSSTSINKILVTFGGNDENNHSYNISQYLCKKGYDVTVILGPTYKNKNKFSKLLRDFKNLKIQNNVKKISKIFNSQDLVICSVGITVYELACLGIPCIMISDNKLQNIMGSEIQKQGFGKNFEKWKNNFDDLENQLVKLNVLKVRKNMATKGKKLIDGKGLFRVTKMILSLI